MCSSRVGQLSSSTWRGPPTGFFVWFTARARPWCSPWSGCSSQPHGRWYLHKSLDSLPPPETLFSDNSLEVVEIWRTGLFGFVYGAHLRKPGP